MSEQIDTQARFARAFVAASQRPATREDRLRRYRRMRGYPLFTPAALAWRHSTMSLAERLAENVFTPSPLLRLLESRRSHE